MQSTRDLRRRIRSISSTAQITKAMQMVAASKMRKAQQAALAGRPFSYLLYRIQREATTRMGGFSHPLLEKRQVQKAGGEGNPFVDRAALREYVKEKEAGYRERLKEEAKNGAKEGS